ncbi:MAG: type II toxin-antitoxin system HicB family antitoxin [Candidatus Brocadiae bacterium]|nr:type II toxin-antitoxin system HicB family antitoxin [Candidatus Brocadiia bacterium]
MQPKGYIIVTVTLFREDDQWVGRCLELGTAACGETLDEAKEAIEEAIFLHLNTLEETGERKSFLQKHGVRFYRRRPHFKHSRVSIPFDDDGLFQRKLVSVQSQ